MAETVVYHLSCYHIITARNVKNQHKGEKVKETEQHIPRIQLHSRRQKLWHTRFICRSEVDICRCNSRNYSQSVCKHAKAKMDYPRLNPNRQCVNCLDNYVTRYQGCSCFQNSREVIKIVIKANLPFQEAYTKWSHRQMNYDGEKPS